MAQRSQSDHQSAQPDSFPATPRNTQWETQDPWSTTFRPWSSTPDSQPTIQSRQTSTQDSQPIQPVIQSQQTGTQDSQPTVQSQQTSIQDFQSPVQTWQTGTQDSQSTIQSRQTSTQDSQPVTQHSQPTIHSRRVSIQEPLPVPHSCQVSIQEPLPVPHSHRVSIQEPLPVPHSRRVSNQGSLLSNIQQLSAEDRAFISSSHYARVPEVRLISYSRHFNPQDALPIFQTHHLDIHSLSLATRSPLTYTSQVSIQPTIQSTRSSLPGSMSPVLARGDVPTSITYSPEASIKSLSDSIIWTSQESFKDSLGGFFQTGQHALESNIHSSPSGSIGGDAGRFRDRCTVSHSQMPVSWRLLHEAKKFSRQLSLVLSLTGMVVLGLISLGQPWIHFQVPLAPPGDPAGSKTIPINTILFVPCPDISCMHEYDQNAYLLDFAWAFLLIASVASFLLCVILINIIFAGSNTPMLDFSSIILSILTGTSMMLGVLFYLMQAHEYLQEGMTYKLGRSFYLAWIGIFLFLMTGFFSYLNYMNFWSLLAIQAIWT